MSSPRILRRLSKVLARFFTTFRMTIAGGVSFAELQINTMGSSVSRKGRISSFTNSRLSRATKRSTRARQSSFTCVTLKRGQRP